jgi:hypothetical protein
MRYLCFWDFTQCTFNCLNVEDETDRLFRNIGIGRENLSCIYIAYELLMEGQGRDAGHMLKHKIT